MQKEQQIAGAVTKADADKVIAASAKGIAPDATAHIDLTAGPVHTASIQAQPSPPIEELQEQVRDVSAFSHSEQVELATTDEMLDIFSNCFEANVLMLGTEATDLARKQ